MKITVRQLKQLIREEVQLATAKNKRRRLYENEEQMPSEQEVISAAKGMTPEEAKQVVKDAGIDMRALLQNPEIRDLVNQAAEEIEEQQSDVSSTGINEYGDADPRQGLAITGIMVGVPTIAHGLFDMALGIQQYSSAGHGPSAVVMGGIAVILASLAAQRAANRTK